MAEFGSGGGELDPQKVVRKRLLEESIRVLGALPEGDAFVRRIRQAADASMEALRGAVADCYDRALYWMEADTAECRKLRSMAQTKRRVPVQDLHHVVGNAFDNHARIDVGRFRRAEGKYSGPDPVHVAPARSSFWGWMRGQVDAACSEYWRDHRRAQDALRRIKGGSENRVAGEYEIHPNPMGDHRAIVIRAALLVRARHLVAETLPPDLAAGALVSPDLAARTGGSDRTKHLHRVLATVLEVLIRIVNERGLRGETLVTTDNITELVDECTRGSLRAEPGMTLDKVDKAMQRGLRSDVLFAAAGALRMALSTDLFESFPDQKLVDQVCWSLEELQIELQLAQVKPVVMLLGYRITSNEVGRRRFAADRAWLNELLAWLEHETAPAQRAQAASRALRWLDTVDVRSALGESPAARARRESDEGGEKSDDAVALLDVRERLRKLVEGFDR